MPTDIESSKLKITKIKGNRVFDTLEPPEKTTIIGELQNLYNESNTMTKRRTKTQDKAAIFDQLKELGNEAMDEFLLRFEPKRGEVSKQYNLMKNRIELLKAGNSGTDVMKEHTPKTSLVDTLRNAGGALGAFAQKLNPIPEQATAAFIPMKGKRATPPKLDIMNPDLSHQLQDATDALSPHQSNLPDEYYSSSAFQLSMWLKSQEERKKSGRRNSWDPDVNV